jgi:metallophosphoesterase (TIGR00282 family)
MHDNLNILFLGDLVGRPGRLSVAQFLKENRDKYDFVIANVENASHGFGLTEKNYNDLSEMGIDAMTSGNHIWDKKEIFDYIYKADKLLRPINYPENTPGVGSRIFKLPNGLKIGVINMQGTVFMSPIAPPWEMLKDEVQKMQFETPIILIDFHAEATAEKVSCGYIADKLSVSAVLGTHTHIQTADERILDGGAAYISDVGFCGAYKSVIGMEIEESVKRLTTGLPVKFDVVPTNEVQVNGVELEINAKTGRTLNIKRVCKVFNLEKGNVEMKG